MLTLEKMPGFAGGSDWGAVIWKKKEVSPNSRFPSYSPKLDSSVV